MQWRQHKGKPVVNTATAETVGKLDGLVIDPSTSKIVSIEVDGQMVSWSDAGGIGPDAVTLRDSELIHVPASSLELAVAEGVMDPFSKPVFTEDGVSLGKLDDIEFDPDDGKVLQLLLTDGDVAGSRLIGIGSYAVVVTAGTAAPAMATPGTRTSKDGDLTSLTKAELYEMAKSRDVEGRSRMSKAELIAALR